MPPKSSHVDFTVRWRVADYDRIRAVADQMSISAGGVVRMATLNWLDRQKEVAVIEPGERPGVSPDATGPEPVLGN